MERYDYIVTGCGLSGLMLAYRFSQDSFFKNKSILLIDAEKKKNDDRTWSYWEKGEGEWDHLIESEWHKIEIKDKKIAKKVVLNPYVYKTIRSSRFYDFIWKELAKNKNIKFKKEKVLNISHRTEFASVLTKTREYQGKKVFNSILFDKSYNQQTKYPVLQQHFVGWFIESKVDYFDDETVTFMDFSIDQKNKTRFMYVLPFSSRNALVEYTLFSEKLLPRYEYDEELEAYLKSKGITEYTIKEVEIGSIPMTNYKFWKRNSSNVLYTGTSGGWTKASTGYTFKNSDKKTKQLIDFLKENDKLKEFRKKSRFWFYDLLFLDVLFKNNELGSVLFTKFFRRNSPDLILRFLDEETSFIQEVKIMLSMPPLRFLAALWRRIKS